MISRWQPLGWLRSVWRGEARGSGLPPLSARCSALVGRAQLANVFAERAFRPSDALPFPGGDAVACELAREGIYWALLALREHSRSDVPRVEASSARESIALATLWSETPPDVLARAAEGNESAARLRRELDNSFADFAEFGPAQQAATAARLHAFAERLIQPLAVSQRAQERVWIKRMQLLVVAAILLFGLGLLGKSLKTRYDLARDLAPASSWTTSSRQPSECSCRSPAQSCAACPNFFFHTRDDSRPFITFDLQSIHALSAVVIENRLDCCTDRATPLVVQVSSDQKSWKTVATHEGDFTTWRAEFPTERARWVRVALTRRGYLHLSRVRLLP